MLNWIVEREKYNESSKIEIKIESYFSLFLILIWSKIKGTAIQDNTIKVKINIDSPKLRLIIKHEIPTIKKEQT